MVISVAIVDDLTADRKQLEEDLRAMFDQIPEHTLSVHSYESAQSFLAGRPDVQMVFLDICMEGMSGIQLAQTLRSTDEKLLIVFVSSSPEFAFDAFPVHPFDYLIKPYSSNKLSHVIREALRVLCAGDPEIPVRVARTVYSVPIGRIVSAVSRGHNVDVTLSDGAVLCSITTFSDLEARLSVYPRFLTVNRGVIVNMDLASALTGDSILMQDGSSFALRSRGRSDVLSRFNQYQFSRVRGGFHG